MRKQYILMSAATVALLVLTACATGQQQIEDTVNFLNALNQGEVEEAREFLCEEQADEMIEGLASVSDEERQQWEFQNINCQSYSGNVLCQYQIVQELEDGTLEQLDHEVVFEIEDGQLCGFAETLGEDMP